MDEATGRVMVCRCGWRGGAMHGEVEAVATTAGLKVTTRRTKVVVDTIGCGIWTLGLQSRRRHGRLGGGVGIIGCNQSQRWVRRHPMQPLVVVWQTQWQHPLAMVARQRNILGQGGGDNLEVGSAATSKVLVWSPPTKAAVR
jgi:hypothetical protein